MRPLSACISAALLLTIAADAASATCKCRAKGVIAKEGQTLCIRTPEGPRLARCGKVLNMSSWTFLDGPCPQAELQLPASLDSRRWTQHPFLLPWGEG